MGVGVGVEGGEVGVEADVGAEVGDAGREGGWDAVEHFLERIAGGGKVSVGRFGGEREWLGGEMETVGGEGWSGPEGGAAVEAVGVELFAPLFTET